MDDFSKMLTLYDPGGGGALKHPRPLCFFCPHAFNFEATILCVGNFSQKNSLTPCGENIFDLGP